MIFKLFVFIDEMVLFFVFFQIKSYFCSNIKWKLHFSNCKNRSYYFFIQKLNGNYTSQVVRIDDFIYR